MQGRFFQCIPAAWGYQPALRPSAARKVRLSCLAFICCEISPEPFCWKMKGKTAKWPSFWGHVFSPVLNLMLLGGKQKASLQLSPLQSPQGGSPGNQRGQSQSKAWGISLLCSTWATWSIHMCSPRSMGCMTRLVNMWPKVWWQWQF